MDDKKAISVLMKLLDKKILNKEESEAISSAIGLFSWTSLSQSRMKKLKAKQDEKLK